MNKADRAKMGRLRRQVKAMGERHRAEYLQQENRIGAVLRKLDEAAVIRERYGNLISFIQNIANTNLETKRLMLEANKAPFDSYAIHRGDSLTRIPLHILKLSVQRNAEQFKTYVCLKFEYKGQPDRFEYAFSDSFLLGHLRFPGAVQRDIAEHIANELSECVVQKFFGENRQ
jgi:hypothetical protein